MTTLEQDNKQAWHLLWGSLLLGILYDFLFYGKETGVSYPIFLVAFYILFCFIFRQQLGFKWGFEWFLWIPILMLAATFAIYSNEMFHFFNYLLVPILLVVQTILLTGNNRKEWFRIGFIEDFLVKGVVHTIGYMFRPFSLVWGSWRKKGDRRVSGNVVKVLIGLAVSFPILLIVVSLLSSADAIFGNWVDQIQISDWLSKIDLGEFPGHFLWILFITLLVFGYLWSLLQPREEEQQEELDPVFPPLKLDGIIATTILALINVVYLIFALIQISYLFGGLHSVLPPGVTYSEYARQGFWQLVVVSIINLVILLTMIQLVKKTESRIYRIVQNLLTILTVCTLVMLFSAFKRMLAYEDAYGYTYLRVLPHAFMILLFVLLVVALVKIWKGNFSLVKYYAVITLIWYVALNYANIDAIIAREDVARYQQIQANAQGGDDQTIDYNYLSSELSYDAVPELVQLRNDPQTDWQATEQLDKQLDRFKQRLQNEHPDGTLPWQSFNWSEYQAAKLLDMSH